MTNLHQIKTLLSSKSSKLKKLVSHAQHLAQLNRILQSLLSVPLKDHIMVANSTHDTLILNVDSAVWLTKGRLQLPVIFDNFKQRSGLSGLCDYRIKINPTMLHGYRVTHCENAAKTNNRGEPTITSQYANPVSEQTLLKITRIANNLQDPNLKKALLKLANTLARN